MLTDDQEQRLQEAFELIVQAVPEHTKLIPEVPLRKRRRALALAAGFAVVLAGFLPLVLFHGGSREQTSPVSTTLPTTSAVAAESETPPIDLLGAPSPLRPPGGSIRGIAAVDDLLYAAVSTAPSDSIAMSTDQGVSWETVLEAEPGDSEGIFGVGQQVALIANDDNPVRDTVEPHSVVTDAPHILVFDPGSGEKRDVALPRPEDPEMTGISLDGSDDSGCALGGYQSWVQARGVAVGDRLVVIGRHTLVGRFPDGSTICDGDVYRYLVWTSDDAGATWQLHDGPALSTVTWTGSRFVAWSAADRPDVTTRDLLVSQDGVNWTKAATSPVIPEGGSFFGASISAGGGRIVAVAGVFARDTQMLDGIANLEQLRDLLGDADVEETLAYLGVDLPLDDSEKQILASFIDVQVPSGAVVAVSDDAGETWTIDLVSNPILSAIAVGDSLVALSFVADDPSQPGSGHSSLLVSTDGRDWEHVADLVLSGFGPHSLTATSTAVYVRTEDDQGLLKIPFSR